MNDRRLSQRWHLPMFVLLLALAGCGDGRRTLSGTVTLDGQPLESGDVLFVKSEGGLVREGAKVKDGTFQVVLPDGEYKVEVNATKVVGKIIVHDMGQKAEVDKTVEMIPERYNTRTTLTASVKSGVAGLKLDLTSKQ
jgi:hypothetical protein